MRLKGNMVMELTDVNTGEVTTITEENMVSNNNIHSKSESSDDDTSSTPSVTSAKITGVFF